jgi:hypothetical protein
MWSLKFVPSRESSLGLLIATLMFDEDSPMKFLAEKSFFRPFPPDGPKRVECCRRFGYVKVGKLWDRLHSQSFKLQYPLDLLLRSLVATYSHDNKQLRTPIRRGMQVIKAFLPTLLSPRPSRPLPRHPPRATLPCSLTSSPSSR